MDEKGKRTAAPDPVGTLPALKLVDTATRDNLMAKGEFEQTAGGTSPPNPFEPGGWFQTAHHSRGSRNYGKYSDPVLDGMIDRQRTLFDRRQRKAAVKEILRYLIDNAPYTGFSGNFNAVATQRKVKSLAPETEGNTFGYQYEQVWLEG